MKKQIEYYQNKLDYEMDPWDLFTAIQKGEAIVPLDARKDSSFHKEHIPGAISLPHREMDEKSNKKPDKSKLNESKSLRVKAKVGNQPKLKKYQEFSPFHHFTMHLPLVVQRLSALPWSVVSF
jgi:rhodanese-related sulfurtransferase